MPRPDGATAGRLHMLHDHDAHDLGHAHDDAAAPGGGCGGGCGGCGAGGGAGNATLR